MRSVRPEPPLPPSPSPVYADLEPGDDKPQQSSYTYRVTLHDTGVFRATVTTNAMQDLPDLSSDVARFACLGLDVIDAVPSPPGKRSLVLRPAIPVYEGTSQEDLCRALTNALHLIDPYSPGEFGALVLAAGLSPREAELIRCAARFAAQLGPSTIRAGIDRTLLDYPGFARDLVGLFTARFDPCSRDYSSHIDDLNSRLLRHVDGARTLEQEQSLASVYSFIASCVRTNWFHHDEHGAPPDYASFKLDSRRLHTIGPVPALPFREIFVCSNAMEGLHVRDGRVARGGVRYSERRDDYRTEVLGLMKTQVVKNSPIIPTGAKGVFVRCGTALTVEEAYTTFVRGLLDVIDDVDGSPLVQPEATIGYDDPDTYLVIAADKGTGTFSDLANALATEAGYWLGDAFASGGSHGYDHKKMGITARGAWVAADSRMALRENRDRDQPLRVVGIGDMSGDVFGNGMLAFPHLRLVAAFDHRHIFIDPDPDPDQSLQARRSLFDRPGSTWDEYDRSAISSGGGVWPRSAKRIALSMPARAALDITDTHPTPDEIVRAILSSDVDLLWNGGIGTFVKATNESHSDVLDPRNDAVRIDASQLRCRAIAEGGNLGITQRARIEFALQSGLVDADFIDNSAGVCTSDLEVNIKIAAQAAVASGSLNRSERDRLLADVEESVARAVLDTTARQTLAVSVAHARGALLLDRHAQLIAGFEQNEGLTRALHCLPDEHVLRARAEAGIGLTRPEIAVLLAQSKSSIARDLLDSNVPEDPAFRSELTAYFPEPLRDRLAPEIQGHHLAREIIATRIASDLVDHLGPGLIHELEERLGAGPARIARAYAATREIFRLDEAWAHAAAAIEYDSALTALLELQRLIERAVEGMLFVCPQLEDTDAAAARYRPHVERFTGGGRLDEPADLLQLIEIAARTHTDITEVYAIYDELRVQLSLCWLTQSTRLLVASDRWQARAIAGIDRTISGALCRLVEIVTASGGDRTDCSAVFAGVPAVRRLKRSIAELRSEPMIDVPRTCAVSIELDEVVRIVALEQHTIPSGN